MADAPTPDPLLERVRGYVTAVGSADEADLAYVLPEARALVERHIGSNTIPDEPKDRAIVEVAAELFYRKNARNGVMDIPGGDLAPFRIARDPMKAAYPILQPFLPGGFA